MIPLTPAFFVAAANAFAGASGDITGDATGDENAIGALLLRALRKGTECGAASLVDHIGYWSHYDQKVDLSSWPLPRNRSCPQLAEFARKWKILMQEPQAGDVFLLNSRAIGDFFRAGVVVSVDERFGRDDEAAFMCTTVDDIGYRGLHAGHRRPHKLRNVRWFSVANGDQFIRWVDIELRVAA